MSEQRPRQARAEQTRAHIVEVAALAFAEHGFDGVSLNDLVKTSEVTKGAFYFHFSSKEALALAAFRAKQEQLVAGLIAATAEAAPATDRLASILRTRARLLGADRSLHCVTRLGADLNLRHGPGSTYAQFQNLGLDLLADVIRDGVRAREFRPEVKPAAAARAIFAWIVGIDTTSLLFAAGNDITERTDEVLALLLPALLISTPTPPRKRKT